MPKGTASSGISASYHGKTAFLLVPGKMPQSVPVSDLRCVLTCFARLLPIKTPTRIAESSEVGRRYLLR